MTLTPIHDPDTVKAISGLALGWHSANDVAWQAVGEDSAARSGIKKWLDALYAAGHLERMFVYNRGRPEVCYLVDRDLTTLDAEPEQ